MNKTELIAVSAEAVGISKKDAERVLNAAIDAMTRTLAQGGRVQLSGFGIFEVRHRKARTGRNPHTREAVEIPAARVPDFKPSKALKDIVGENHAAG